MLKKIIVLMSCAVVFGCGSSDKNAAVTATETTGSSATNSWGVPSTATSSWGVPSDGASSWGAPSSGTSSWGVPMGSGTAAGGGGDGGAGGGGCVTEQLGLPNCPTIKVCSSADGSNITYTVAPGTFTTPNAAFAACQ